MLSKTPSVSLLCNLDNKDKLPACSADNPNCFVKVDWVTNVCPPKSAIKPVWDDNSKKDLFKSLLVRNNFSLLAAAIAKLNCKSRAAVADIPVFFARLDIFWLASNVPLTKSKREAWANLVRVSTSLKLEESNFERVPDLSNWSANSPKLFEANPNKPTCFWASSFTPCIAFKLSIWILSPSFNVNNDSSSIFPPILLITLAFLKIVSLSFSILEISFSMFLDTFFPFSISFNSVSCLSKDLFDLLIALVKSFPKESTIPCDSFERLLKLLPISLWRLCPILLKVSSNNWNSSLKAAVCFFNFPQIVTWLPKIAYGP